MFKELVKSLDCVGFNSQIYKVSDRIREMGIPYDILSKWSNKKGVKLPESKIDEIQDLARECVDGVFEIDSIIEVFTAKRNGLARHVFELRSAFPSFKSAIIKDMCDIAKDENGKDYNQQAREILAKFLGYDLLPESIVNVCMFMEGNSTVGVSFGIRGKPTRIGMGIPVAIDYTNDYHVNRMDDDHLGFASVSVDELDKMIPLLVLEISVGAGDSDCWAMKFKSVEELRSAIEKVIDYDVRKSIKKVEDISDVKDADDFSAWRMLRAANRRAAENLDSPLAVDKEVKSEEWN